MNKKINLLVLFFTLIGGCYVQASGTARIVTPAGTTSNQRVTNGCDVTTTSFCAGNCPLPSVPAIDRLQGRISYYSDSLSGRSTASGEPYQPRLLTAAHLELPFGTIVRITRLSNGRQVIVRINDRGPSRRGGRILDLSRAAAECLDMIRAGVTDVRADVIQLGRGRR